MTFEQTIKAYLDKRAKEDALFANTYKKEGKSIKECCKYIMQKARKEAKNGCAAIPDDVVYGWAVHYYDEDDIKVSGTTEDVQVSVPEQPVPKEDPAADPYPKKEAHKPKKAKADKTPQPVFTLFDGML
jgi:hypothetical protein